MRSLFADLNHWIGFAKARVGHPQGDRYRSAYELIQDQVQAGTLMLPLSATHYQEISDIGSLRQRSDIALTMDRLSRYRALANRAVLLRHEVLAAVSGWRGLPEPPMPVRFGRGFRFVFRHPDGDLIAPPQLERRAPQILAMNGSASAVIAKVEAMSAGWTFHGHGDDRPEVALIADVVREGQEYAMLRGPEPSELPRLRLGGYSPETWRESLKTITAREQELAAKLASGDAKRSRLDDIIAGRLYVWELSPHLMAVLQQLGIEPDEVLSDADLLESLLLSMSTMQVETALRRANWRSGSYRWADNDIHDLAQLGPAAAYCDIVFTEKHAAAKLRAAHIDRRYNTTIVSRVEELVEHLTAV